TTDGILAVAMTCLVHSCHLWLRRNVFLSNSGQAWEERVGAVILLAGIGLVGWSADRLLLWQQAGIWIVLLLAAGLLLRRGWLKLLGPLFLYELVRAGRRSRYVLLRLYVYFILIPSLFSTVGWWADDQRIMALPVTKAAGVFQAFFFFFIT